MTDLTYKEAGVDYDLIDEFKRIARLAGHSTIGVLAEKGIRLEEDGVFLLPQGSSGVRVKSIIEGLGTKSLIAKAFHEQTGILKYNEVAHDAVAAIVHDVMVKNADPFCVLMELLAAESEWFANTKRWRNLILGWEMACYHSRCAWVGGETAVYPGMLQPGVIVVSGGADGIIPHGRRPIGHSFVRPGDTIVFVEGLSIHANGSSLARKVSERLPDGYATRMPDGMMYGEALLQKTPLYAPLLKKWHDEELDIHALVPVTGHGWRKLMLPRPLEYIIEEMPREQTVFSFIAEQGGISPLEMFRNFNMGVGLGVYVAASHADRLVGVTEQAGFRARCAGVVRAAKAHPVVTIVPLKLELAG